MIDARKISVCLLLSFITINMNAQKVVKLWEGNPLTNNEISEPEKYERGEGWVTN